MKKALSYFTIIIIFFLISFGSGFIVSWKTMKPEKIEVIKNVEVIKTVDKIVYRDYTKADIMSLLYSYDTEPMAIDYTINELNKKYTDIDVNWKLFERSGSENIKVPVYQQGNFKFYFGVGLGVAAVGGITYLMMR